MRISCLFINHNVMLPYRIIRSPSGLFHTFENIRGIDDTEVLVKRLHRRGDAGEEIVITGPGLAP